MFCVSVVEASTASLPVWILIKNRPLFPKLLKALGDSHFSTGKGGDSPNRRQGAGGDGVRCFSARVPSLNIAIAIESPPELIFVRPFRWRTLLVGPFLLEAQPQPDTFGPSCNFMWQQAQDFRPRSWSFARAGSSLIAWWRRSTSQSPSFGR